MPARWRCGRRRAASAGSTGPAFVQATFGQMAEDAVQVQLVGAHDEVREGMQPQVRVRRGTGSLVEVDLEPDDLDGHVPSLIGADQGLERGDGGIVCSGRSRAHVRVPRIEDRAVAGDRGQADTPYSACVAHPSTLSRREARDFTHDGVSRLDPWCSI